MDVSKLLEALRLMLEIPVKNASEKYPLVTLIVLCLAPVLWILASRIQF